MGITARMQRSMGATRRQATRNVGGVTWTSAGDGCWRHGAWTCEINGEGRWELTGARLVDRVGVVRDPDGYVLVPSLREATAIVVRLTRGDMS